MLRKYSASLLTIFAFCVICLSPTQSYAYLSEIKILEKKEITRLTDDAVTSTYLDVVIEIEANNISHKTAGFTPREFQQYKDLLRYRYELKSELQKRQLDIPVIEPNTTP